jgi:thiamine biosynthesis protein ThiS
MKAGIEEIEIKEDKTIKELMDELKLSSTPILLELNREIFYPDEIQGKTIKKGDKVALIPIVAGG